MGAHIEWIDGKMKVGIVRAGNTFSSYGDQYEFIFIVLQQGDEARLVAGVGTISKKIADEIISVLARDTDIKFITWERRRVKTGTTHVAGPYNLDNWR